MPAAHKLGTLTVFAALVVACGDAAPPPARPPLVDASAGDAAPGPEPARGPAAAPSPSPRERAQEEHRRAADAYGRGDYAAARAHWEEALRLDPHATMVLINIINAAEREGNLAAACDALARARRARLNAEDLNTLEARYSGRC